MVNVPAAGQLDQASRRHFFVGAIYGLWALLSAAFAIPAFVYLFFPPKAGREEEWVEVGDVTKIAPNSPVELAFRRNRVDGWKVYSEKSTAWVVRQPGNTIAAFAPQCTHLGCAYHWDERKSEFLCPCHNSLFAIDGKVVSGPAPRPLDRYDTKIDGNRLFLGKMREGSERPV